MRPTVLREIHNILFNKSAYTLNQVRVDILQHEFSGALGRKTLCDMFSAFILDCEYEHAGFRWQYRLVSKQMTRTGVLQQARAFVHLIRQIPKADRFPGYYTDAEDLTRFFCGATENWHFCIESRKQEAGRGWKKREPPAPTGDGYWKRQYSKMLARA